MTRCLISVDARSERFQVIADAGPCIREKHNMQFFSSVIGKNSRQRALAALVVVSALFLTALGAGGCSVNRGGQSMEDGAFAESVAEQKRLNRYFQSAVLPNVKSCWNDLKAEGSVELRYWYNKSSYGTWKFQKLEAGESTLSEIQAKAAAECMRKAVNGTSFRREPTDSGETYFLSWTWPLPLPADAAAQMTRLANTDGGTGTGCDGKGAPANCMRCTSTNTCIKVCVGYPTCSILSGPDWSTCSGGGECASGGLFGWVGAKYTQQ
jgi:hypothetical protein